MHILAEIFWLPKAGNSLEEYEDAYWPERQLDRDVQRFSFAVADGATETSFSGLWAKMLVRAYCKGHLGVKKLPQFLPRLRHTWFKELSTKSLPWYAEEKLRSGAFSSLLGLTVEAPRNGSRAARWQAVAIGDSCLFQVRGGDLITAFPLTHSGQFNSRPILLSSNSDSSNHSVENLIHAEGVWETEDAFYLMTDALACWFFETVERGEKPWKILRGLETSDQVAPFSVWITELRNTKAIRNDDVTLFRINVL